MDDETQAQRLAAWLSSPAGTAPPEDLDPEVLGAVWALVPDRAPAPRVSIDDIFSLVTEGPFAAPSVAAPSVVAPSVVGETTGAVVRFPGSADSDADDNEWDADDLTHVAPTAPARLVAHPGGKTEGVTAPVAAPQIAPVAASVGARVGAPVAAEGGRASPPADASTVVPLPRRAPSRAWMLPTIGLALAAAAATLIVVPTMGKLAPADVAEMEAARDMQAPPSRAIPELSAEGGERSEDAAAPVAAAPSASTTGAPSMSAAPSASPGLSASPSVVALERGDASVAQTQARAEPAPVGSAGGGAGGLAQADITTREQAPPPPPRALPELEEKESTSVLSASSGRDRDADASWAKAEQPAPARSSGYGAGAPASTAPASPASTASATSAEKSKTYIPESAGPLAPREAADDSLLDGGAFGADQEETVAVGRAESAKKDSAGKAPKPSSTTRSAKAYEEAADEADDIGAPAQSASRSAPSADASNVLTASARATAWPNDYDSAWYRSLADVAPAFDAARADEAAGRYDDALARYRTLAADGRATVAQDASLRAAKALKSLGRTQEALATVDTGLNRSGANTACRSALYALRGDLLVLLGRAGEAEGAWANAARLNAAR